MARGSLDITKQISVEYHYVYRHKEGKSIYVITNMEFFNDKGQNIDNMLSDIDMVYMAANINSVRANLVSIYDYTKRKIYNYLNNNNDEK